MNTVRRYLTPSIAALFVFALAASALAVAGDLLPNEKASEKAKAKVAEAKQRSELGTEVKGEEEGSEPVNHGHCVSYWARAAKEGGLRSKDKGAFISSVARDQEAASAKLAEDDAPTGQCGSYQDDLDAAASAQPVESGRENGRGGKGSSAAKSEGKGKSDEHRRDGS